MLLFFFFFSSRRRHTRCLSDWSSDVCSSDLDDHGPDRLTDLHAHGTISRRDDAIERGPVDGPAGDSAAAGAQATGVDGRFDTQVTERAEGDAPHAAGSPGGDLGLGDPPVHHAPVSERYVVGA